jgi:hypothetical protein
MPSGPTAASASASPDPNVRTVHPNHRGAHNNRRCTPPDPGRRTVRNCPVVEDSAISAPSDTKDRLTCDLRLLHRLHQDPPAQRQGPFCPGRQAQRQGPRLARLCRQRGDRRRLEAHRQGYRPGVLLDQARRPLVPGCGLCQPRRDRGRRLRLDLDAPGTLIRRQRRPGRHRGAAAFCCKEQRGVDIPACNPSRRQSAIARSRKHSVTPFSILANPETSFKPPHRRQESNAAAPGNPEPYLSQRSRHCIMPGQAVSSSHGCPQFCRAQRAR